MAAPPDTPATLLELADWRRQTAVLYDDVRRLAAGDPGAALEHWRRVRQQLLTTNDGNDCSDCAGLEETPAIVRLGSPTTNWHPSGG